MRAARIAQPMPAKELISSAVAFVVAIAAAAKSVQ
jgi:hypothetical protein